ncbi:DNA adenine methylase [Paenibacillus massiliensis]|uniref:DNA adenine methylase n=1 Tax=Paenibacillus massiliensis TaxID=225917 RepID=UPI000429C3C2|nr:DNA adenine methylase [Paenibacillus massiliensis]
MRNNNVIRSPLRFPGSKSKVLNRIQPYLLTHHKEYREPFLGGGSIFLSKPLSSINWINDKDFRVFNFFNVIRDSPDHLCKMIKETQPTVELWREFRSMAASEDKVFQAFQFLFFNRTNYSGIYNANPIGGLNQNSKYKIDCRWNPEMLCSRIQLCSDKLQSIKITNQDFSNLILAPGEDVLLLIDPPYYVKGNSLYPIGMKPDEHRALARLLKETTHKFLLTIDDNEHTREIYKSDDFIYNQETWFYTVHSKKKDNTGKELFISNFQLEKS